MGATILPRHAKRLATRPEAPAPGWLAAARPARSLLPAQRHRTAGKVLHLDPRWPRLFTALAGGSNGWTEPPPVTVSPRRGDAGRFRG